MYGDTHITGIHISLSEIFVTLEETTKACNMAGDGAEEVLQSLIDTLELCVGKIKGKVV